MSKKIVYSLVANPATMDARVMKQARALRDSGYRVIVFGRIDPSHAKTQEIVDGIEVRRFDCYSPLGLSEQGLERAAELVPNVSEKLKTHTKSLMSWSPLLRKPVVRTTGTLSGSTQIVNRARAGGHSIIVKSIWRLKGFIKRIVSVHPGLYAWVIQKKEQREARDHKSKRQAPSRQTKLDDLFFSRYAVYACNFADLSFPETPDIVHCHDIYPLLGGVLLAKRSGAKVVFDAHEIETERVPPMPSDRKQFVDQLERNLFTQIDQIVTCCDSAADFYGKRFTLRKPVVVMNSPQFGAADDTSSIDVRAQIDVPPSSKIVIFTGGVGREARGLDKVAEALRLLPDYHLVVLGPRHSANDQWLTSKAAEVGVAHRIHLLPRVEPEQVVAAVRSGDVGVCPIQDVSLSYRYAMPNKLFEMTFADLPICVSNLPEMAKFVTELGVGVVMDETDPAAIADALKETASNRKKYSLTNSAQQVLNEKYSWTQQAKTLVRTYEDITRTMVDA